MVWLLQLYSSRMVETGDGVVSCGGELLLVRGCIRGM